jgi:uncharacterized protein YjbI with pentapeptide repeats
MSDGTCEYVLDPDNPETWSSEQRDECYVRNSILNDDGIWSCPHEPAEKDDLCIFHKDIAAKSESEVIEAFFEIVVDRESKSQHPCQLIGAKFGDFDITNDDPNSTIEIPPVDFSHSEFMGELIWSKATVVKSYFRGCTFNAEIDFRNVRFEQGADYTGVTCEASTDFFATRFRGDTSFAEAIFKAENKFNSATFGADSTFSSAQFIGATTFRKSTSSQAVDFTDVVFKTCPEFRFADFEHECDFAETMFERVRISAVPHLVRRHPFEKRFSVLKQRSKTRCLMAR